MAYSFRLIAWHAVAPRLHTPADWQQWAEHPESLADLPERAPDLTHIPALQRRRLAPAARLMTAALQPLFRCEEADPYAPQRDRHSP